MRGASPQTTLGSADDLLRGFVGQQMLTGDWCGGRATVIIQDCSTGEAVSFINSRKPYLILESSALKSSEV